MGSHNTHAPLDSNWREAASNASKVGNNAIIYGHKNGKLVHISSVESGLKCECTCPSCCRTLVAKKGKIKVHHFAHISSAECVTAAETVLHILSKEILSELSLITIPNYVYNRKKLVRGQENIVYQQLLYEGGTIPIEAVFVEQNRGGYTPDIEIIANGNKLVIEVAVTHRVDERKLRLFRKANIPAIEIRLSKEHAYLSREDLRHLIETDITIKHWLYHPMEREAIAAFFRKYRSIKKPYYKRAPILINDISASTGAKKKNIDPKRFEEIGNKFFLENKRWPTVAELKLRWPELYGSGK